MFLEAEILFVRRAGRRESTQRTSLSSLPQVAVAGREGLGVS